MKTLLSTSRGHFNVHLYGDSNDTPLILVHGWPQTGYSWHHMSSYLKGFYIVCPDLRGMGDSNRDLDIKLYSKDNMAADIFAIADQLGINEFALGGHDWGGAIVQEMAFINPQRINQLIVLNMVIINNTVGQSKASEIMIQQQFRSSWYQFLMSIKDLPEALIAGKEEIWVRFFSRGIANPIPEDAIQEYIRCYKIPNSITTAANIYRNIPSDRKRWKAYEGKKVQIPTLIIHGVLDPVIIKEYVEGVEECYDDVIVVQLKGGHFIVDELPEDVANAITNFLKTD